MSAPTIRRGDVYWVSVPRPGSIDRPHPHVVVQDDVFNRSRIDTVVVCALTTNPRRANEPGNVLLDEGEGELPQRSVVVVSQISTVSKDALGTRLGVLSESRVDQIVRGLRFQQVSRGLGGSAQRTDPHTLYDYLFSGNGWKVRRTLRLLKVPYRWVPLDILTGETRSPSFLEKNRVGEIPVLELPDGTCLAESHSILQYLAEGTPWLPCDPVARAHVTRWLCFEQTHIDGVISRARFRYAYPSVVETTGDEFARWHKQGRAALDVLERHLSGLRWLANDLPSIADIAMCAYVQVADEARLPIEHYPAILTWVERVASLPGHIPIDEAPPEP